jgi:hypothetical protein
MTITPAERSKAYRQKQIEKYGLEEYRKRESDKRKARRNKLKEAKTKQSTAKPPATRSKEYRQRQIEKYGEDEYRKKESEKRKERRTKLKEIQIKEAKAKPARIKSVEEMKAFNVKEQLFNIKSNVLARYTQSTHDNQWYKVDRIHKLLTNTPLTDSFELFRDTDRVFDLINTNPKWKTDETRNSYRQALSGLLKYVDGFQSEYQIYSKSSVDNRKAITETAGDIILSQKESENYIPWTQLVKAVDNKELDDKEKALLGLYLLLPPKRLQISRLLTLTNKKTGHDKNYNYLVLVKNKPSHIMLYNHKTKFKYPDVRIPLPKKLIKLFQRYIKTNKIQLNEPIFPNRTGTYYTSISDVLSKIFNKVFAPKHVTLNSLRHAYIINFLKKKRSPNQRKVLAKEMLHSVYQQSLYDRLV